MHKKANFAIAALIALVVIAAGVVALSIGDKTIHGYVFYSGNDSDKLVQIALKAAALPSMDLNTVNSAESYKEFADNMNDLTFILNEQQDWFDIPTIDNGVQAWDKISKVLTEYTPLIENYNDVVFSAQKFTSQKNDTNLQEFYIASTRFGFETVTIMGAVFYTASYETVGAIYRASGAQALALKCSSCVSVALSTTHWTIRNSLVEASSLVAKKIEELDPQELWNTSMDSIRAQAEKTVNSRIPAGIEKGKEFYSVTKNKSSDWAGSLRNKWENR
jgi:hypothetical protein